MLKAWALIIVAYLAAGAVASGVGFWLHAAHPLVILGAADFAATVVIFLFSLALKNSSWYDPYWSVVPPFFALFWLLQPGSTGFASLRHTLVFALICLWALRLTTNWGYQWRDMRHEDWRYQDMQKQYGRFYWPMSFLGIHLFPTTLVFLGCLALWPALERGVQPFNWLDVLAFLVTLGAITIETTADLQMRRFRRTTHAPDQVIPPGIWKFTRHPNYFGEVSFWWGLFLFGLAAAPSFWWTIIGPLAILALFLGLSIPLMEKHLLAKRPGYVEYQKQVSAFVPLPKRASRAAMRVNDG